MSAAARRGASRKACAALVLALLSVSPAAAAQQAAAGTVKTAAGPAFEAQVPHARKLPSSQTSGNVKVRKAAKPGIKPAAKGAIPGTYQVRKGDTLFAVARRIRHGGVTPNQMLAALYRANPDAFPGGDINQLQEASVLAVPSKGDAEALNRAEADRAVRSLLAPRSALPPPIPAAREAITDPSALTEPLKPAARPAPRLTREEAEARYREGLALERSGEERGALRAFLEAGESDHGLAQKKLGEIYDRGNSAVERDYQSSIRWTQKAREQGVNLAKPFSFPAGR